MIDTLKFTDSVGVTHTCFFDSPVPEREAFKWMRDINARNVELERRAQREAGVLVELVEP